MQVPPALSLQDISVEVTGESTRNDRTQGAGQNEISVDCTRIFAHRGNAMSELRHLLEYRGEHIFTTLGACPSVCAAYKLLLDGDHEGAENRFRRILKDDPKDNESLAGLAICLAEEGGRFLTAEKLAKQAVRLDKTSAAGYIGLGYIYLLGGRIDEGFKHLMKAKHLAPRDPRLHRGFALYDRERPPVLSGMSRKHPVNQVLNEVRNIKRNPRALALLFVGVVGGLYLAGNLVI